MKRKGIFFSTILLTGLMLSACGMQNFTERDLQFQLAPSHTLGYEISDTGEITITERIMTFSTSAGSMGLTVTGYDVTYYDGAGAEISPKVTPEDPPFTLSVYVPAGYTCEAPDERLGCSIMDEGSRAAPGPIVEATSAGNLLPGDVAELHLDDWMTNGPTSSLKWRAEFTFHGFRSDGAEFVAGPYSVAIVPPN